MVYRFNPDEDQLLERLLVVLEAEYWDNPPFLRKQDLGKINKLRSQLGLLPVDSQLKELKPVANQEIIEEKELRPLPPPDPHLMARTIYTDYLEKQEMMRPHRAYAKRLLRATDDVKGTTPVMPLAKMGTGGGPLLCDWCQKQFLLECGLYHNVEAGVAWRDRTQVLGHEPHAWHSFISGHITFMVVENGTLRVYHGYDTSGCGGRAVKKMEEEQQEFFSSKRGRLPAGFKKAMHEYLQDEQGMFGMGQQQQDIIQSIIYELYNYDPGIGVNRPY